MGSSLSIDGTSGKLIKRRELDQEYGENQAKSKSSSNEVENPMKHAR